MKIKVLGTGCANCKKLEELATRAVTELGLDAEVVKVWLKVARGIINFVPAVQIGRRVCGQHSSGMLLY